MANAATKPVKLTKEQRNFILNRVIDTIAEHFDKRAKAAAEKSDAHIEEKHRALWERVKKRVAKKIAAANIDDFEFMLCRNGNDVAAQITADQLTAAEKVGFAKITTLRNEHRQAIQAAHTRIERFGGRNTYDNCVRFTVLSKDQAKLKEAGQRLHDLEGELLFVGTCDLDTLMAQCLAKFNDILK